MQLRGGRLQPLTLLGGGLLLVGCILGAVRPARATAAGALALAGACLAAHRPPDHRGPHHPLCV